MIIFYIGIALTIISSILGLISLKCDNETGEVLFMTGFGLLLASGIVLALATIIQL